MCDCEGDGTATEGRLRKSSMKCGALKRKQIGHQILTMAVHSRSVKEHGLERREAQMRCLDRRTHRSRRVRLPPCVLCSSQQLRRSPSRPASQLVLVRALPEAHRVRRKPARAESRCRRRIRAPLWVQAPHFSRDHRYHLRQRRPRTGSGRVRCSPRRLRRMNRERQAAAVHPGIARPCRRVKATTWLVSECVV